MSNKIYYNTDFNDNTVQFSTTNAKQFNSFKFRLQKIGYKIIKIVLTDDGEFKLLAKIKKKPLTKCLLKEKNISENDRVYPKCTTYPELCEFHRNGICECVDHKFCLYQDTLEHKSVLNIMVNNYKNYDPEHTNTCSTYYEDTEFGRIFSKEYDHLNSPNRKNSGYYRHHGR